VAISTSRWLRRCAPRHDGSSKEALLSISATRPIEAFLEPRHRELAAAVAAFAAAEIAPLPAPADDDAARRQAREILARLGAGGWIRWAIPEAWGGHAETPGLRACCLVREALAAA
jgi:alkylation response protein AidB-like acyl-CoA dehydrogenase